MVRDEMLKRRLHAGMPGPTPSFSARVSKALSGLPARKPTLLAVLPASAVVFVAVAVVSVLLVNSGGLTGGGPSPGLPNAAGDQTAGPESSEPTEAATPTQGVILPDSDTKLLMWAELVALTPEELNLACDEITRAGSLNDIQRANIMLIQAAESAIKGQFIEVASGTNLDFDQDGELETLTFSGNESSMTLEMKDGATTARWVIKCEQPSKKVYLGDLDLTDGVLDLLVDEFGPSDDFAVSVAGVRQASFMERGKVPGMISQLKPDGKGAVSTTRRMNILMTWFADVKYQLDGAGALALAPRASYSMGNYKCTVRVDIPLHSSADASAGVAFTVPAGTAVSLVSTDDKEWIEIKTPEGTGWLHMADAMTLADPQIPGFEAFDGLNMAD